MDQPEGRRATLGFELAGVDVESEAGVDDEACAPFGVSDLGESRPGSLSSSSNLLLKYMGINRLDNWRTPTAANEYSGSAGARRFAMWAGGSTWVMKSSADSAWGVFRDICLHYLMKISHERYA